MSEPSLISPLLDGFVMGDPISEHDGVRCYPAMQLETDKKYIVKVVSIPASQSKLAALLLAGAFSSREDALVYFKELADDVVEEAALLQRLSRFEGFVPYEKWQLVPMDPETGYDVYLLGAYRPTLDACLERNNMTHLGAVNLGLDLCAALSVCRRFGYIYADLRPSNIYICNEREYRIGDLGFISLSSLPYASLPEKYHSAFTPPEISDAYSALNATMDTYAVGMILYMAYNDGQLPEDQGALLPPRHADQELSSIILKACSVDPNERWQDPMQMGQALINYLQRGNVNDIPIVPPPVQPETDSELPEAAPDENDDASLNTADIIAQVDEALENAVSEATSEDIVADSSEDSIEVPSADEHNDVAQTSEGMPHEDITAISNGDETEPTVEENDPVAEAAEETGTPADEEPATEEEAPVDEVPEFDEALTTAPDESDTEQILAQADDLIAHELPAPVIPPEPIEVTLPQPEVQVDEPAEALSDEEGPSCDTPTTEEDVSIAEEDAPCDAPVAVADTPAEETQTEQLPDEADAETEESALIEEEDDQAEDVALSKPVHRGNRRLFAAIVCCVTALVLLLGGFLFYEEYYLQNIDHLTISGNEDRLTVEISSEVDEALLSVVCTDIYGTTQRQNVINGTAVFENLNPGMNYKIQVKIDGFHQLTGNTSATYTTSQMTIVSDLHGAIGSEDGSLLLTFSVQGPDAQQWIVHYSAPGEEAKSVSFSGHMVTITGLTVGKEYSIELEPATQLYLIGDTTLSFFSSNVIVAENLQILGFQNNGLHITWSAPEGEIVKLWSVRCYNDTYDQTFTTTDPSIILEGLDSAAGYTIEVTADGMSTNARVSLPAGSASVQQIKLDDSVKGSLQISWTFLGVAPEEGWRILYTVDGSDTQVISCDVAQATIYPVIPGGTYSISIQSASGSTVFGGNTTYTAPAAESFSGYGITSDTVSMKMCITPSIADWDRWDVKDKDFTTSFAVGVSASFTTRLTTSYSKSDDEIVTMLVIRDAHGKLVSVTTENKTWSEMWHQYRGKITIPAMPDQVGAYTIEIYYNFAHVTTRDFTITE